MEPVVLLEHILDGREKPADLPFELLKNITENFAEDREIGQGGFATVYKGVLPNGIVAVKRIRSSHSINQKLFYRELDSLLTVNHENVVRFLGFCASTNEMAIKIEGLKGHIYAEVRERLLCLEYVSNGSLQKYITDELRGLEWDTRYRIIRGICEGLHHLHKENQIYHMDLKPANILIDSHMVPKITDFGLSRLDQKSETMSEDRLGSLGYCAPEYLHCGKMSFKSDMYSLGVIIIELVTGEKGIPDNNINNVLRRWRHRWKKSGNETPLVYQQVTKCMEIGLLCQEIDASKRPFIWDLIHDVREMDGVSGTISNSCGYRFGQISPYSEDDMLGVEPLELHFPFELNKQISCSLKLTNRTDAYIAFNIEKLSPLPYCTQPNKDIVPPRSECSVDVTLHPQDKVPRDMQRTDEFTVWSIKVNYGLATEDININMFNKEKGTVDSINLDVVFDVEESTKIIKEPILHSITENMSKSTKESSETQQTSNTTSEKSMDSIKTIQEASETLSSCMVDAQGFERVYKMRRSTFNYVCSLVRIPFLQDMMSRDHTFVDGRVLSLQDRVAVAVRVLNSCEPPGIVGSSIGVDESTALLVTQVFVQAMSKNEMMYACWPRSSIKMESIKRKFDKIHGLPNCCGVVHIAHFKFGSQNPHYRSQGGARLQVVIGPDLRFTTICLGPSNSTDLSSILHFSYLYKESEKGIWLNGTKLNLSNGSSIGEYIIGGSGYPLRPWLLTPYRLKGDLSDPDYKKEFNRRHSKATSVVALRALTRLKDTWKCLQEEGWHLNNQANMWQRICTCCLLHNIVIDMEEEEEEEEDACMSSDQQLNKIKPVRQLVDEDAVKMRDALSQHLMESGEEKQVVPAASLFRDGNRRQEEFRRQKAFRAKGTVRDS